MNRPAVVALLVTAAVVAAAVATTPAPLGGQAPLPDIGPDPDAWIAAAERRTAAAQPIVPGTEKRIRWYRERRGALTPWAVVYIHGFSATRQELAPVAERLADRLGANLFETRLAGHGLADEPLTGIRAEDWLADAAEALAVGQRIGDRILLLGTSTGATLALAMADHDAFDAVGALVLVSPNFAPRDRNAQLLTGPGGPLLAKLIAGETRSWEPHNAEQGKYWSTRYPIAAAVEMMRLVDRVRNSLPLPLPVPVLAFYSPDDTVVDPSATLAALKLIDSPYRQAVVIADSGDPSGHVLAGDILSPGNNERLVAEIAGFLARAGL